MLSSSRQHTVSKIHAQHIKRIQYDPSPENIERSKHMFAVDVQVFLRYTATIEWITPSWCKVAVSSKRDKLPTRGTSFGKLIQPYWTEYLNKQQAIAPRQQTQQAQLLVRVPEQETAGTPSGVSTQII